MAPLQFFFAHHGVWAVAALLLLENTGFPLPGEASLLYAAYLSRQGRLAPWPELLIVACLACTLGDNLGYWLGREAGVGAQRWLGLTPGRIGYAQRYFQRYGAVTVFFARFVAGLRIAAGPVSGVSRMEWKRFAVANVLGALAWVTTMTGAGYWLGGSIHRLIHSASWFSLALLAVAGAAIALALHKIRRDVQPGGAHDA